MNSCCIFLGSQLYYKFICMHVSAIFQVYLPFFRCFCHFTCYFSDIPVIFQIYLPFYPPFSDDPAIFISHFYRLVYLLFVSCTSHFQVYLPFLECTCIFTCKETMVLLTICYTIAIKEVTAHTISFFWSFLFLLLTSDINSSIFSTA